MVTAMVLGGLIAGSLAPLASAQNGNEGNGRGNSPDGPPGLDGDGPGNSNGNGQGKEKENGNNGQGNGSNNGKQRSKDLLTVVAKPSTGTAAIVPVLPGDEANNWRYVSCLPAGSSPSLIFPFEFKLTNENGVAGDEATVELDPSGRLAELTTVPAAFKILDNGVMQPREVKVNALNLADGAYTLNVHVRATPQRSVESTHKMVHIHLLVGRACGGDSDDSSGSGTGSGSGGSSVPTPTEGGFFTDGDFNLLENCAGADVATNTGGTFEIVARSQSNVISSTNPGNFFLNMLWKNDNADKNVTIDLSAVNLVPRGANAVHAGQFTTTGFTSNEDNFEMVGDDGAPCGPQGPCTVKVGANKTLWVSWHLTLSRKGESAAGISTTCADATTLPISATATLKDKDNNNAQLTTTTVSAKGYVK